MPGGTARGEHDAVHLQQLLVGDVQPAEPRRAVFLEQPAAQRVPQALGLLHDLLEHEVREAAALDGGEVQSTRVTVFSLSTVSRSRMR